MSHNPSNLTDAFTLAAPGLLADPCWHGAWFDGEWHAAEVALATIEPATGQVLAEVGQAGAVEVHAAAVKAAQAQLAWAARGTEARAEVMSRAADLLNEHRVGVVEWLIRESGSIRPKAEFEVDATVTELKHAAAQFLHAPGELLSSPDPARLSFARRVPLGVVGVITPWNVPLYLAMRSVAPALVTGNAVLLKPDPHTPVSGGVLLARLFEAAGLPAGVLAVLPGAAEAGEAVVSDPMVRMVTFTGSTAVGRRVGELAGRHIKKVALELGGNSPFIVLDDCDLPRAAAAGAFGSFFHQGQICMASGRHIVHRRVLDDYLELLTRKAAALSVGNPALHSVALGPMINSRQLTRAHALVSASIEAGARLCTGGTYEGLYYQPTVLADVQPAMPVFAQEIFAPVAPVTVAEDEDHAVALANQTEYGLAAAVMTGRLERGLALAQRLHAGMVHINDQTVNDLSQAPMGGRGQSGNGARFSSGTSWDEFTEWQWLTASAQVPDYP